jgi:protein-tyrosine phosphatase
MHVLMVCLGNICRSPLAEGILKHHALQQNLGWNVDSAGMGGWHAGQPPDARSIRIARQYGIDISQQSARQFSVKDFDRFDLIYAMDTENLRDILKKARHDDDRHKVRLIMNEVFPGENISVPDPYYNDDGFEEVFQMLDKACAKIVTKF